MMSGRKRTISLNCSLAVPTTASSAPTLTGNTTPNTPEILNAIINISSDHLQTFNVHQPTNNPIKYEEESAPEYTCNNPIIPPSSFTNCSINSTITTFPSSTSVSPPYDSACCYQQTPPQDGNFLNPNMLVQRYHSQFIKEGLKLKVKQKIKEEPINCESGKLEIEDIKKENEDLTIEDEERRRRRRERNKVAATKCRNKKKERTTLLIAEGEVLEIQNSSYKEELIRLEAEKRRLTDILAEHEPTCVKKPRLEKGANSKDQKNPNVFKVPQTPTKKESQRVSNMNSARVDSKSYSGTSNPAIVPGESPFTNEFQYFNNYNESLDQQCGNMFSKQCEQQSLEQLNSLEQQAPPNGFFNYSFYGANPKNNFLDSQSLCLSNYCFNGVDSMCVAL